MFISIFSLNISYLFFFCAIRDYWIIASKIFAKIKQVLKKSDKVLFDFKRRDFLRKVGRYSFFGLTSSAIVYGYYSAVCEPQVVRVNIKSEYEKLKSLKIAQFTDLHVGPTIGYDYVEKVCKKINNLFADIIIFTGDLVDGDSKAFAFDISCLSELKAPYGKYFVTGNHEYYFGVKQCLEHIKTLGFKPLINEHRVINHNDHLLTLAGVTDLKAGQFLKEHETSPLKAINGCPQKSFKLLCAHHPRSIYEASENGFDFQISGHTHGGQYFPFNYIVRLEHPFVKGLYEYKNTKLYVSQGTGYWGPPIRVGTFPEITLFEFV